MMTKLARAEHLTTAPDAVRDALEKGFVGNLSDVTISCETTEYGPKHIESTAHMVAVCSAGGARVCGAQRKPINFGGDNNSGGSSTRQMVS